MTFPWSSHYLLHVHGSQCFKDDAVLGVAARSNLKMIKLSQATIHMRLRFKLEGFSSTYHGYDTFELKDQWKKN